MHVTQAINAMGGVLRSAIVTDCEITDFVIDSRKVVEGSCFVAFKGDNTDGNLYAEQALKDGAVLAVLEDEEVFNRMSGNRVLVKSSLDALKTVGAYNLGKFKGVKVAVTGSVGKTTTKELISCVLAAKKKVYTAYGNYNNELGVAICAANLKNRSGFAVFEMGTNSAGEIAALSKYIKPDVAVVTLVGHAHIGRFGDIDGLAAEKLSIIDGMADGATLWVHDSCRRFIGERELSRVNVRYFGTDMMSHVILAEKNRTASGDFYFTAVMRNTPYCFKLNHIYSHFVENSLAAIGIGMSLGLSYTEVMKGIRNFQPADGRGKITEYGEYKIIDDTYNAGFESVMGAMNNLAEIPASQKTAVIGEMGEIEGFEEQLYQKLIKRAQELKGVNFIFVGGGFKDFKEADNIRIVAEKTDAMKKVADVEGGIMLFKASRSRRFEDFINHLQKEKEQRAV
ncbi:UDP-N-acetylmuramoyl-tripeptide--D-alanyl-D-alanine ligase [Seleniivibrio woodruffii]|uniref:UDP-N-acetylmuramoyl-tripeptide--D-alanyl-D-alanine ligase n=1 Tax=Seleniivibrio woodruffii TaxID=1078050 RepID=A0A4R1K305_9BACT|nr:UDP-N-acetylmuramoyl-tripeptide--D-alanyl-D-alanine ligase [Seleniivibrio woodruffii]TCK58217.1 UDP-N-acetylmuramoyl-tripeptide--D-alanyl-D-alanine ligase [Seleniivibrio woodruffii]TVZ35682.1 UDP-N-acetylmuramoyl-tripeptide--D-alanyl-D-alanine ligase [Seleniivibrio woodruffii]